MKKRYLLLLQIILSVFLVSSLAFATSININGAMEDDEWDGYQTVEDWVGDNGLVGPGYGGQAFDAEKIGLFIGDGTLYFGLQTGFDITGVNTVSGYEGGDFALNFGNGDDKTFEFGFDYSIETNSTGAASVTLYSVTSWIDPVIDIPEYKASTPWKMGDADSAKTLLASNITAFYGSGTDQYGNANHTLEGSVNLSILTDIVGTDYDFVTAHWTMECGNDVLETTYHAPEPTTLLLFGMGLLGAGAFGRKRYNKEQA